MDVIYSTRLARIRRAVFPVVFPEPVDGGAWSTRAMRGEELWLVDRPRGAGPGVNVAASVAGLAAVVTARRRLVPAVVAIAAQTALLLVYRELPACRFDHRRREETTSGGTAR